MMDRPDQHAGLSEAGTEAEANLAIEGLCLTADEKAFLAALDAEELSPEERVRRVRAYALRGLRPSAAAE